MANYLEFYLVDEEKDSAVIKEVFINFLFIDYLFEGLEEKDPTFNEIGSFWENLEPIKYGLLKPRDKGICWHSTTLINYFSQNELIKMFNHWISLLNVLSEEYILNDFNRKIYSQEDIKRDENLKENAFNRLEVLERVKECLEIAQMIDSPRYILMCEAL